MLDKVYTDERDTDIIEMILLVYKRTLSDNQHIKIVAQELQKSRAWLQMVQGIQ